MKRQTKQRVLLSLFVILFISIIGFAVWIWKDNDRNKRTEDASRPSMSDQVVSEPEVKAWEESKYLKGLPANKADAIFPREVMTKRSLAEQAENPKVKAAIELYRKNRDRKFAIDELRLVYLPAGVSGTAWYRKGDDLTSHPKRLPSGSAVWVDSNGEIVLIGGCGNFFEMTQSPQAVSKPRAKKACTKPKAPCQKVAYKAPCEETLIAPPPVVREEWVQPARTAVAKQSSYSTPQGRMDYKAGQSMYGWYNYSRKSKPKTCPTDDQPPIQPPTEWITPCR